MVKVVKHKHSIDLYLAAPAAPGRQAKKQGREARAPTELLQSAPSHDRIVSKVDQGFCDGAQH